VAVSKAEDPTLMLEEETDVLTLGLAGLTVSVSDDPSGQAVSTALLPPPPLYRACQ